MDNWDEVRTALQVAREGTVSGAAQRLGVHHATVIRHVDALEDRLGVKLFQRHSRGYTPTEAGDELMRVGQVTEDQFSALEGKLKGKGSEVSGELVITTLSTMAIDMIPILATFQQEYPDVKIRMLTGERVFRLEYGEAHVAIRAGLKPDEPDNVVQKYRDYELCLFASRSYVEQFGIPDSISDFTNHRFVARDGLPSRAPFFRWQEENIPDSSVIFRTTDELSVLKAVKEGIGIGFASTQVGDADPDLVRMWKAEEEWCVHLWIVTHVDLHRTAKVQAIVKALKAGV